MLKALYKTNNINIQRSRYISTLSIKQKYDIIFIKQSNHLNHFIKINKTVVNFFFIMYMQ